FGSFGRLYRVLGVSIPNREKEKFQQAVWEFMCMPTVSIPNREKEKFQLVFCAKKAACQMFQSLIGRKRNF
ncbi:hypothetical protein, partial [Brasilonema bromeliae]|uniref:hypothetical protein n=1 Tax=Brasilonema bromeliae TaxID=383615 RepID=UPI001B7D05A5